MKDAGVSAVRTRVAHAGREEHRYCGCLLFAELSGRESYTGLIALAVTGRRFSAEECAVLDDVACVSSVADPRIWPFKLTRIVAEFGSIQSAVAAGNLCLEEALIGPGPCQAVARLLSDLAREFGHDVSRAAAALPDRVQEGIPPGWGVPFRRQDERFEALRRCMQVRGRVELVHWRLAEAAIDVLRRTRGIEPNITLGVTAAYLDLGIAPSDVVPLVTALVQTVFVANAVEAARQAPSILRRLPDHVISYVGRKPRASPRSG